MHRIAADKLHFAPFDRQRKAMEALLRQGHFRNATDFLRRAVDHYLEHLGRPALSEQARQMADDFEVSRAAEPDPTGLQDASRGTDEPW